MGLFCRLRRVLRQSLPIRVGAAVLAGSALTSLAPARAWGVMIQILHTNDLHSHFEHAEDRTRGHYAAVKTVIDRLRADARARGMETITLDAGDFSEGTPFFFAEEGALSWRAMDEMGYDAVTLGNHDYLTGQVDLERIIAETRPRFALLASNFTAENRLRTLRSTIKPYAEIRRAGLRIAVVGATTDDMIYRWRAGAGAITAPQPALKKAIDAVRGRNDLVIALTHIGTSDDKKWIAGVAGVDLVVGGHSHEALYPNAWQKDAKGRFVPIVQAGKHGEFVGRFWVDVVPGQPARYVGYDLVPVRVDGEHEPRMEQFVQGARARFEAQFRTQWLHEVIGSTHVPMIPPNSSDTTWGNLFGSAMRRATGAELSIDAGPLFGDWQPAGPITREKLFNFYPRTFEFGPGIGWGIWLAECDGWIIQLLVEQFTKGGLHATLGGNDGKPLYWFKRYTVAVPESIGRAIKEMMPGLDLIFLNPRDSGVTVLESVEREIQRQGGAI